MSKKFIIDQRGRKWKIYEPAKNKPEVIDLWMALVKVKEINCAVLVKLPLFTYPILPNYIDHTIDYILHMCFVCGNNKMKLATLCLLFGRQHEKVVWITTILCEKCNGKPVTEDASYCGNAFLLSNAIHEEFIKHGITKEKHICYICGFANSTVKSNKCSTICEESMKLMIKWQWETEPTLSAEKLWLFLSDLCYREIDIFTSTVYRLCEWRNCGKLGCQQCPKCRRIFWCSNNLHREASMHTCIPHSDYFHFTRSIFIKFK